MDICAELSTRERMVLATCELLEAQGYHATGLNEILQRCLTRDLTKRYSTADELMTALEYYIYHSGYGPTNETLGKFIRELFGQAIPPAAAAPARGGTELLEHTARIAKV